MKARIWTLGDSETPTAEMDIADHDARFFEDLPFTSSNVARVETRDDSEREEDE